MPAVKNVPATKSAKAEKAVKTTVKNAKTPAQRKAAKAKTTRVTTRATKASATKAAKKAPAPWVRQSTVSPGEGVAASRFTTQTQRRLLREICDAGGAPVEYSERAATVTIPRLAELGYVSVAKNGTPKATATGKAFIASLA